ncbi:MAG: hypothetical protein J6I74_00265 [Schwartzia sp.]|nr:hypothetical protein [Schwartzia sp. (in: firmicutes)]
MRLFYEAFPIVNALRSQLSWTHYRMLMRVADSKARESYADECAFAGNDDEHITMTERKKPS